MPVTIDGTNGVSKVAPGGVNQAAIAVGVAGTGPAFSARLAGNQAISATTWTKLSLATEEFDTDAAFNTTTYRFQPAVAGYYQFNGSVYMLTSGPTILAALYKNGAAVRRGTQSGNITGAGWGALVSALLYLNGTTDYVELWGYTDTANTIGTGADTTYFDGHLVRAA